MFKCLQPNAAKRHVATLMRFSLRHDTGTYVKQCSTNLQPICSGLAMSPIHQFSRLH